MTITAANAEACTHTFEALFGCAAEYEGARAKFAVGSSLVSVLQSDTPRGVDGVTFAVASATAPAALLERAGRPVASHGGRIVLPREHSSGVEVTLVDVEPSEPGTEPTGIVLDHLAIAVRDLTAGVARWTGILGVEAGETGPHPLGGITMARFFLGSQMIELISPVAGAKSATQRRLDERGEGPIALALVPSDLPAARTRLLGAGIRLLERPPHTFIHPSDTGGVLVQLTPRLEHGH